MLLQHSQPFSPCHASRRANVGIRAVKTHLRGSAGALPVLYIDWPPGNAVLPAPGSDSQDPVPLTLRLAAQGLRVEEARLGNLHDITLPGVPAELGIGFRAGLALAWQQLPPVDQDFRIPEELAGDAPAASQDPRIPIHASLGREGVRLAVLLAEHAAVTGDAPPDARPALVKLPDGRAEVAAQQQAPSLDQRSYVDA